MKVVVARVSGWRLIAVVLALRSWMKKMFRISEKQVKLASEQAQTRNGVYLTVGKQTLFWVRIKNSIVFKRLTEKIVFLKKYSSFFSAYFSDLSNRQPYINGCVYMLQKIRDVQNSGVWIMSSSFSGRFIVWRRRPLSSNMYI